MVHLTREQKISRALKGHPIYKSKIRSANISKALKGKVSLFKGKHHTEEAKLKNRLAHLGKPSKSKTKFVKNDIRVMGINNNNWKGGITPEKRKIRESIEYRLWREAVFARDNWTCQNCGKIGGELHADHIKMFAFHIELRFAINNGRTLCKSCDSKLNTSHSRKHICCL